MEDYGNQDSGYGPAFTSDQPQGMMGNAMVNALDALPPWWVLAGAGSHKRFNTMVRGGYREGKALKPFLNNRGILRNRRPGFNVLPNTLTKPRTTGWTKNRVTDAFRGRYSQLGVVTSGKPYTPFSSFVGAGFNGAANLMHKTSWGRNIASSWDDSPGGKFQFLEQGLMSKVSYARHIDRTPGVTHMNYGAILGQGRTGELSRAADALSRPGSTASLSEKMMANRASIRGSAKLNAVRSNPLLTGGDALLLDSKGALGRWTGGFRMTDRISQQMASTTASMNAARAGKNIMSMPADDAVAHIKNLQGLQGSLDDGAAAIATGTRLGGKAAASGARLAANLAEKEAMHAGGSRGLLKVGKTVARSFTTQVVEEGAAVGAKRIAVAQGAKVMAGYGARWGVASANIWNPIGWALTAYQIYFTAKLATGLARDLVIKPAAKLVKEGYESLTGSLDKPVMGMGYRDTEAAATSRARGVQAIQNSRLNARSVLGSEAGMMNAHFG